MAAKIEIVDNALVITDTDTGIIMHDVPAKDHYYNNTQLKKGNVQIYDVYGLNEDLAKIFTDSLDNTVDGNDVVFTDTTFRDFARLNLGKSSPQASGAITVNQSNAVKVLGGVIDSDKVYIIDGVVDIGSTEIEVPSGGISMIGYTFDVSRLISSESNYTMFKSPVGGSGNVLAVDMAIEVTGASSKAFELISATGFDAFEFTRVNFNDCTSLGVIDNYRQGLESGTGRFGGTPELELKGSWGGGYFIDTSIIRSLQDGNYSIYKAGAGFVMSSRFRTNQNIDLPANVAFMDFSSSNFQNPSTFQLNECIITRNGVSNPEDTNITPNINNTELPSSWVNNQGVKNTFVGGKMSVILEATTIISNTNDFVDLNATYLTSDLQHFTEDVSGQLKHLGSNPREFRVFFDGIIDGGSNDVLILKLVRWDDSQSAFEDIGIQVRQVNALVGSRDVAFFNYVTTVELDKNDYVKWQVRNTSRTNNLTYELDGSWVIEAR